MPNHKLLKKFLLVITLFVAQALAEPGLSTLTVVLPQVPQPYSQVFDEIVRGIQNEMAQPIRNIVIDQKTDQDAIRRQLQSQSPQSVISLGNHAKKLLAPLESEHDIVYGAVFLNPDEESKNLKGISLTPSPDATLSWLHTLIPEIQTVHVVYQDKYNGWLIDLAKRQATQHSITIADHPVNDVREAANEFRKIIENSDAKSHSIWLLQRDPSVDEKAVVPDILAQAWNRDFVVFSSNPSHVPRGALFALYPDNEKMGTSLARMAKNPNKQGVVPLSDLLIAVNVRTASHVGKNFTHSEEKQFNLIFPNQ